MTDENLDKFFQAEQDAMISKLNPEDVADALDYDQVFEAVVQVVLQSPIGGIVGMVGGDRALDPIKVPLTGMIRSVVSEAMKSEAFLEALEGKLLPSQMGVEVKAKVEDIVDLRLAELTPQMVKEIMQDMIQQHLGWLVVWGGVFGGLIGFVMSLVN